MLSRASALGKAEPAGSLDFEARGEGVDDRQIEIVEPRLHDHAAGPVAAGEPDIALREHDRRRRQLPVAADLRDLGRPREPEGEAVHRALHRGADVVGRERRIDADAERHRIRALRKDLRRAGAAAIVDPRPRRLERELPAPQPRDLDVAHDRRRIRIEHHRRLHDRALDRGRHVAGDLRAVGRRGDLDPLVAPLSSQLRDPLYPLARHAERADPRPGRRLRHLPAEGHARDRQLVDLERERPAPGQGHNIGCERPVGRLSGRRDRPALGGASDGRIDVPEAEAEPRIGRLKLDLRGRLGAGHADGERAVGGAVAAQAEVDAPARPIGALAAGDPKLRRGHPYAIEADHARRIECQIGADRRDATEEIAHRRIVDLPRAGDEAAANAEAARVAHHVEIGGDVDQADALDPVVVDPSLERSAVDAAREIEGDDRRSDQPVRTDADIVGDDLRSVDREVAGELDVGEQSPERRIEAEDPGRAGGERHDDAVVAHLGAAPRPQPFDHGGAEAEARRAQVVADERPVHLAVEQQGEPEVAAAQVRRQRPRLGHPHRDLKAFEPVAAEVENALRVDRRRAAVGAQPQIGAAILPGSRQVDHCQRRHQPLRLAGEDEVEAHRPGDRVGPLARLHGYVGEGLASHRGAEAAVPRIPAAAPFEMGVDRPVEPRDAGEEAIGRPACEEGQVEPVLGGHRIDAHDQPVAPRRARGADGAEIEADLGAAVVDPDPALDRHHVRPSAHRRIDDELAEMEAPNVDVDIGKQGRVGIAGVEDRQPHQPRPRDVQLLDVDMIAEIGEGPVVDARDRRVEEGAARIPQGQVVDGEVAEDRAFDPANVDIEAGGGLELVDLADDEAAARIGVQPDQEGADQDDDDADRDAEPLGDAARHGALAPAAPRRLDDVRPRGGRGRFARHQKACPIDM